MNRTMLAALVGGLLWGLNGGTATAAPRLQQAFELAGAEFQVPPELLMAVSYSVTSWNNARGYDAHSAQEFGVMGLRAQTEGPSLEEAAALLGLPEETVRDDMVQNIRGGAALLASYAFQANGGEKVGAELNLDTARAWWDAVGEYSGVVDARHQDMFAVQLFETLDAGAEGRAFTGEMIRLYPLSMPSVIGEFIQDARRQYQRQMAAQPSAVDYSGATWVAACSSNYTNDSRTAADIAYVIVHKIEGSYNGCISWFQNCSSQVSAHYVIGKSGGVTQMVREEDIAWHAGNWTYNTQSVGLEHEGYTYTDDITDTEYRASAALTADICNRNGIPKNRTYIIGHNEVPGATHTDPGPYWDWNYYIQLVGGQPSDPGDDDTPTPTPSGTGDLVGMIKANDIYSGTPIAGATVKLSNGKSTTTSSSGYYEFNGLTAGSYSITADADCYGAETISRTVTAGVDNWGSIALFDDGSCGGTDPEPDPGDCMLSARLAPTAHTASTSPLSGLPAGSVGFVAFGALALLYRRRQGR